jgi:hypothetical protein
LVTARFDEATSAAIASPAALIEGVVEEESAEAFGLSDAETESKGLEKPPPEAKTFTASLRSI